MTKDSYLTALRPLALTAAWFAFLASTAFAWAAIEGHATHRTAKHHMHVAL